MAFGGFQSQCIMDLSQPTLGPCALSGSALYTSGQVSRQSDDHQFYMTGLDSSYDKYMADRSMATFTVPGAEHTPYLTSEMQMSPFGFNGGTAFMQPFDCQNLIHGLSQQSAAITNGVMSFPVNGFPPGKHKVSRSNKLRNKVGELHPFYSRRLAGCAPVEGRTRTRDKYRVVYTEKQRLGLEKAFKDDKFITTAKKTELSKALELSDRQIKIWFQNRRAKERRDDRKNSPAESCPENSKENCRPSKPSCRFENEADSSCTIQDTVGHPVMQTSTQPGYPVSCYSVKYEASAIPQTTISKPTENEVTSKCQDIAHARFQTSPSGWTDAHYQSFMPGVNVSPFTSCMNFLPRS